MACEIHMVTLQRSLLAVRAVLGLQTSNSGYITRYDSYRYRSGIERRLENVQRGKHLVNYITCIKKILVIMATITTRCIEIVLK